MNTLTWPLPSFRRLLHDLLANPERAAYARVGTEAGNGGENWLARDYTLFDPHDIPPQGALRVVLAAAPPPLPDLHWPTASPHSLLGHLYLGQGAWRGQAWGFVRVGQGIERIETLDLVGPGMHRLPLMDASKPAGDASLGGRPDSDRPPARWSRTAGALGGVDVWRRLVSRRFAVIGVGRTGSMVAASLAGLGVSRLSLIDPDRLEEQNLGEMVSVRPEDCGSRKVDAVAGALRSVLSGTSTEIDPAPVSITDPQGLAAARECDVLCCCSDNDAARLAVAVIAALYHRVLLDIGTGIFFGDASASEHGSGQGAWTPAAPRPREMGADVRLVLPGDGCLLCRGSLSAYGQAVEDLCRRRPPALLSEQTRSRRAGSLASLNQVACGLGMQMLQDLFAGRIGRSTWARLEAKAQDGEARLSLHYPEATAPQTCALCSRAGMGDEGLR